MCGTDWLRSRWGENSLLLNSYENCNDDDKPGIEKLISKYELPLRIAALLHDTGHCLFSHCSERVINNLSEGNDSSENILEDNYPTAKEISKIFTTHFHKEKNEDGKEKNIPFAEIFAISFIGNKYFSEFVNHLDIYKKSELIDKLEITANFILGLPDPKNSESIFLAQLISSGLDADKIDYMARESLYSGIKLEIDLDRVLLNKYRY
jgi:HD superfamily phosphohydrolase